MKLYNEQNQFINVFSCEEEDKRRIPEEYEYRRYWNH